MPVALENVKHGTRHMFHIGIFGSKIALIILLLILSFVNADVSFIKEKPRAFLGESIVVGLSAAVPFAFIALNRGKEIGDAMSLAITAFLIFFLFHIVMEFSGANKMSTGNGTLTSSQQAQEKVMSAVAHFKATKIIIGIVLGVMLLLALTVMDVGPGMSTVIKEAFVMALCGALPVVMIAKDRDEKDSRKVLLDFLMYFAAFFVGHMILQLGGFYTHLFLSKPDEIPIKTE